MQDSENGNHCKLGYHKTKKTRHVFLVLHDAECCYQTARQSRFDEIYTVWQITGIDCFSKRIIVTCHNQFAYHKIQTIFK
jgi:hypothetical protein